MLLSARLLQDVSSANLFRIVNQISARAGSTIDIYFQLVDRDQDREFNPPGRRFMPASNSTLLVSLKSVYPRKQLAFPATQPFPQDPSIWRFQIQPNDGKVAPAPGGGPIIDYSNLVPLGEPFDFNVAITDFGMVGTFGMILTLTERQSYSATATLVGVLPDDELVVNGVTFTCVAAGATGTQFNVGGTDSITANNLASVINTNSATANVTALVSGNVILLTGVRTATITATSSPSITVSTPVLSPDSRVTTGWAESAISIAPSFPVV
jgi:hypothetical protein